MRLSFFSFLKIAAVFLVLILSSILYTYRLELGLVKTKFQPNVIFIVVDTLRADYLGTYGFQGDISPNIDKLAKNSVVFERAISQAPWTKPSVASIMTGLHVKTHGVTDYPRKKVEKSIPQKGPKLDRIPDSAVTMAEVFKDSGYQTAAFSGNTYISKSGGFSQGFQHFKSTAVYKGYRDPEIVKDVKSWLSIKKNDLPYFMYVQFMDVHGPYAYTKEDYDLLRESPSIGADLKLTPNQVPNAALNLLGHGPTEEEVANRRSYRAAYAAGIKKFDRMFGEFYEYLRKSGELDNTVLVFTSDHGEELFDHGKWDHGYSLYEELIRVPLFISLPQKMDSPLDKRTARYQDLVASIDLFPTLVELAIVDSLPSSLDHLQGHSFAALLQNKDFKSSNVVFSAGHRLRPSLLTYREDFKKLIWDYPTNVRSLFDLEQDSVEGKDLMTTEPRLLGRLEAGASDYMKQLDLQPKLEQAEQALSELEYNKLKSLGYLK